MNFLKGFVDGILADDLDRDVNYNELQRGAPGESAGNMADSSYQDNGLSRKLDDIYREERRNCISSLLIRYGEGQVQRLNEHLKSNNETVMALAKRLDEAYQSLGDFNNELEALSGENVNMRNKNAELSNQLELLHLENVNLRTVISQREIDAKSQEARIAELTGLLSENAVTFDQMQKQCECMAKNSAEVESLRKELANANAHIESLKKERDSLINSSFDADNRIKEAVRRQDRAIAIAKLMAQETSYLYAEKNLQKKPLSEHIDHSAYAETLKTVAELKAEVEKLKEENSDLKDVNGKLHNMISDLSNKSCKMQESYLREAIEALGKRHLKQLKPVQLIYVQPTGVLNLDLDLDLISREMSHVLKSVQPQPKLTVKAEASDANKAGECTRYFDTEPISKAGSRTSTKESALKLAPSVSSTERKREAWGDDWDIYDEILETESTAEQKKETNMTESATARKESAKSKSVWNDDLDELLKDM